MNCYLMSWARAEVARQQILDALDKIPSVLNWRASTGAIFIVSELSANALSDEINSLVPSHVHFVLAPINIEQIHGYTDEKTWNFIRHLRRSSQK